jgi:heme-degrading monooxygenase HmoA
MIAIARFEVPLGQAAQFEEQLSVALAALAVAPGFVDGEIGQNLDELGLWAIITRWENVGSYRRALSANRSKLEAIPVLALAIDEPGAYELPINE